MTSPSGYLLELVDACSQRGALILCTQYDVDNWYYRIDCHRAEDKGSAVAEAVTALCELIDELLKDIQHLDLECISTRYLLSRSMDEDQGCLLRSDILENLGRRYYGSPTYQLFKAIKYDGGDPMEFRDYLVNEQKACKGEWPC